MLEGGKYCREKSSKVIWKYIGVRSSILNEVHVVGMPEKGISEQRKEGSGKEPGGQVWMKCSRQRWWKHSEEASVTPVLAREEGYGMESYGWWEGWMAEKSVGPCRSLYGLWPLFWVKWNPLLDFLAEEWNNFSIYLFILIN